MISKWLERRRKRKEQAKCNHEWYVLENGTDYGFYMEKIYYVTGYCPKCDKEHTVDLEHYDKWKRKLEIQRKWEEAEK